MSPASVATHKGLILPGAGARGAYQVGVLKALAEMLPKHAGNPFAVLSGTSAGAINAAVLASRAANFQHAVREMEQVWANFHVEQVFRTDNWTMLKSSLHWFAALVLGGLGVRNPGSLLDSSPLRDLLARSIRLPKIAQAIERGQLEALAVTASAYSSARSVTFYQSRTRTQPWARVRRIGRPAQITLDHLMASAAVPFICAPVRIGGEYYGDGSMRHRAPLSSAIHLGADRLLVIGVRDEHPDPEPVADQVPSKPSFAHLAGYMLDTLFMDGLYADLERITRINMILEQTGSRELQPPLAKLRTLNTLIIVPKQDIREVAARHVHQLPRGLRLLLRGLGAMNRDGMQLISYLLFESGFTRELIQMGYRDALEQEADLRAFIFDQSMDTLDAPIHLKAELQH
jgi:NTE family protein